MLTSTLSRQLLKEITFLLSLILVFYIVPNFQPSPSPKQDAGTGGNRSLKQLVLTSIPPELLLRTVSFLSYLILVFHIVSDFQPHQIQNNSLAQAGIDTCYLDLTDKFWRDHYTTKANGAGSCLSVILNPRLLHCTQFSTLIKLKTSRWPRQESIPVTQA